MSETVTAARRVALARSQSRPGTKDFIDALFTDFFELRGDRCAGEDGSILGGLAFFEGRPVTVLAQRKGKTLSENMALNFGMANPEGYRKARRLMEDAQRFGRPVITFIDTPGAYPGIRAEEQGQGEAIARCIAAMSALTVPTLAVVTGEGGSGGALALGVGNSLLMLENAVYSVLSPEGFAAILWKDSSRRDEAAELMRLTARDLVRLGVADELIPEPPGGMDGGPGDAQVYRKLRGALSRELARFSKMSGPALARHRYQKYRGIGAAAPGKKGREGR